MSEWKTVGRFPNQFSYRVEDGKHITGTVTRLPEYATVDEFAAAVAEVLPLFIDAPKIQIADDNQYWDSCSHYLCLAGERYCTDEELARIKQDRDKKAAAAKRARERKKAAEVKTLERLLAKYPVATSSSLGPAS